MHPSRAFDLLAAFVALTTGLLASLSAQASAIAPNETLLFIPGIARCLPDGRLDVEVSAWLYEKARRPGLHTAFAKYLGLNLAALTPAGRALFRQRTQLFRVDSADNKLISIRFADGITRFTLPPTGEGGRSTGQLLLTAEASDSQSPQLTSQPLSPWITFRAELPIGDTREFLGRALQVPAQGLSIISDIDDTIKHTQVRNSHEMMLNTFTRPFTEVPGMAAQYQRMAGDAQTRFHYLSGSPIQLYPPLANFLSEAGFPDGSIHLRESTSWRNLLSNAASSRAHKLSVIEKLLAYFPHRRFLLIGDSGEADPEIYAQVLRTHPLQIEAIVIRDVSDEDRSSARYRKTFGDLDAARWFILQEGQPWPEWTAPDFQP